MKNRIRLLAAMLVLLLLAGCAGTGENSSRQESGQSGDSSAPAVSETNAGSTEPGSFPISEEPIHLRIVVPVTSDHSVSLNDLDMFQAYSEKSNVYVEWEEISNTAFGEKYKLLLATNDLPDAFGAGFGYESSVIYKYAQEGSIIPLEDLIEQYGVNTKKYLEEREDFRKLSTYPDGHIYTLPAIDENQNIRVDAMWWMNQTYLDKLGMEWPETLDEIGDYLRTVTTQDLNGDGKNEIGLSFSTDTSNANVPNRLTYLVGYFGAPWDASNYMTQTVDGKGPLEFAPATQATKETLEYLHEWYSEGLIDPEIFTQNGQQIKAKAKGEGIGASITFWYLDLNDGDESQNEYRLIDMPQNADNTALWRRNKLIPGYTPDQFFITSANQYPAETLRYIDYWMDNGENALINRFGPQGYSWDYLENGKWTELTNVPSGEVRTMANTTLKSPWAHGVPYWCFSDFWHEKEITAPQALERQNAISNSYILQATQGLPDLVYSEAENQEMLEIKTDLFSYVNTQFAQFLTNGVTDESWEEYINKLKGLGMERYAELYNQYYEIFQG